MNEILMFTVKAAIAVGLGTIGYLVVVKTTMNVAFKESMNLLQKYLEELQDKDLI